MAQQAITPKASASLDGKELISGGDSLRWPLREGVQPVVRTLTMAPADAIQFVGRTRPITLKILPLEGAPVIVSNLWVLNVSPGEHPYHSSVKVADRRWFWNYAHVLGRYNMRRNVGIKRLLANDLDLLVNFDRDFDIAYWQWSINAGRKWTSRAMLTDVMNQALRAEEAYWGRSPKVTLDTRLGTKMRGLSIEELQIDDPGDQAVARALAYLPEAGITVDYDGSVVIFSRAAGDEIGIVKAMMPEIFGRGHTDLVKNQVIRPQEVHVLFTREVEVRFDFVEVASTRGTQVVSDEPMGDLRRMQNVLPIPDYDVTVNNRRMPQGSWVDFDDAFRSWGNLPLIGDTRPLDHDLLQRAFIPHMDLWAALGIVGELPDSKAELQPWVARIAMSQEHYRQTFQLNRRWMDRFFSFRSYRLSTINPQTGQRGPSLAYGDYSLLPSQRSRYRNHLQGLPFYYAINKSAYPTGANEYLDSTATPSPGVVSVLDHDQGVIRIDYAMDRNRSYEMVLPSQIETDTTPTFDLTKYRSRPVAFNEIIEGQQPPRLASAFKLAVIVSAVPASPNTTQQLHRIVVKPNDIASMLPPAARVGLRQALGPVMEIRIGAGVEVARIAWRDDKAAIIEQIFGLTKVPDDAKAQENFSREVSNLCLNEGSTEGKAGASLNQIARARAASIYASLVDRYEGSMTGYMNGNIHLSGWTSEIVHEYTKAAETFTRIVFPEAVPQMSLFSFLSASERALVLRQAQPDPS